MAHGSGLKNVGGVATHACFAHFPGSGAKQFPGMRCMHCEHLLKVSKHGHVCVKAAQLVKFVVKKTWPRNRHISTQALACKYFERTTKALF